MKKNMFLEIATASIAALVFPVDLRAQNATTCGVPPTLIFGSVNSTVSFDRTKNVYTYTYTVENEKSSPQKLRQFIVDIEESPQNINSPDKWRGRFRETEGPRHLMWSTSNLGLSPGSKVSGFSFQSTRGPGIVKFHIEGDSDATAFLTSEDDASTAEPCPGFFEEASFLERKVVGVTQGPMPAGQVPAKIRIHYEEGDAEERIHKLDGDDHGFVFVTLFGSDQLSISSVDTSTVIFGPASAKPISTKIIGPTGTDKAAVNAKKLVMKFNIKDLGLRCNIDRALFVSGKVSGGTFFGGAEVKPSICRPKPQPPQEPKKSKPKKKIGL